MYSETTNSILVTVKPFYLEDQSSPNELKIAVPAFSLDSPHQSNRLN